MQCTHSSFIQSMELCHLLKSMVVRRGENEDGRGRSNGVEGIGSRGRKTEQTNIDIFKKGPPNHGRFELPKRDGKGPGRENSISREN